MTTDGLRLPTTKYHQLKRKFVIACLKTQTNFIQHKSKAKFELPSSETKLLL